MAWYCGCILWVWIVAALFDFQSALSKYLCTEMSILTRVNYYQRVVIFELLASCLLLLCVIEFSYVTTARHLVDSCRSMSEGTQNPQLKARRSTANIVVGLTVIFVISYVPYHAFWTYLICSQEDKFLSKFPEFLIIRITNFNTRI